LWVSGLVYSVYAAGVGVGVIGTVCRVVPTGSVRRVVGPCDVSLRGGRRSLGADLQYCTCQRLSASMGGRSCDVVSCAYVAVVGRRCHGLPRVVPCAAFGGRCWCSWACDNSRLWRLQACGTRSNSPEYAAMASASRKGVGWSLRREPAIERTEQDREAM